MHNLTIECTLAEVHLPVRLQCTIKGGEVGFAGERTVSSGSLAWLLRHGYELCS